MAIKSLTTADRPAYPQAAYVLGLKPEWMFGQAMDTYPIDVGSREEVPPVAITLSADAARENVEFITGLIQRAGCEASSSA